MIPNRNLNLGEKRLPGSFSPRSEPSKPFSVRYEEVNAMLLNEFLKAHRKIEDQGAMIERQQKQIEALTAGLQEVKAEVETRRLPQTVASNQ